MLQLLRIYLQHTLTLGRHSTLYPTVIADASTRDRDLSMLASSVNVLAMFLYANILYVGHAISLQECLALPEV